MRVLLLNPPHPAVSSRCHEGQMPPLGLLAVGGPVIEAGHRARLIDAELGPLSLPAIASAAAAWAPDAVFLGHSGSTSAHPVIARIARALKAAMADVRIVYGGVYPTYHATEILSSQSIGRRPRCTSAETVQESLASLLRNLPKYLPRFDRNGLEELPPPTGGTNPPREVLVSESLSQHPTNFPEALPPDPVATENAVLTRQDGLPKAPISRRQRLDPQRRHSGIFGMHRAGEAVLRVLRRLKKGVANR